MKLFIRRASTPSLFLFAIFTFSLLFLLLCYQYRGEAGLSYFSDAWPYEAIVAAQKGDVVSIHLLIQKGKQEYLGEIIPGAYHNRNCIMEASRCGRTEVVKLLLTYHVSLQERDAEGKTALILARENHHENIVHLLKQAGATE